MSRFTIDLIGGSSKKQKTHEINQTFERGSIKNFDLDQIVAMDQIMRWTEAEDEVDSEDCEERHS